jgi:Fe-S-cluster-containing hydrogenase component 2
MHPFNVFADVPGAAGKKVAMVKQKATSCDLCSDFAEPSCVFACPHDAAHRVDPRQFFAGLLQKASDSIPKE